MKFLSINLLLVFLLGISTSFLIHGDETPHGGKVIHANHGYNIEKVQGIKRVFFYLLGNDERTTIKDKNLSGLVEFTLKDGTKEKHNLILSKDNEALKVVFSERKRIKSSVIYINHKGKKITAKFN